MSRKEGISLRDGSTSDRHASVVYSTESTATSDNLKNALRHHATATSEGAAVSPVDYFRGAAVSHVDYFRGPLASPAQLHESASALYASDLYREHMTENHNTFSEHMGPLPLYMPDCQRHLSKTLLKKMLAHMYETARAQEATDHVQASLVEYGHSRATSKKMLYTCIYAIPQ